MFVFGSSLPGDEISCFIYTFRSEEKSVAAYDLVLDIMKKDPLACIKEIKLGKCKVDEIHEWNVIEPFWLLVSFAKEDMMAVDDWLCKHDKVQSDDLYAGTGRYTEYKTYTTTVKETYYKDGKMLSPRKKMDIEWDG